MAEVTAPPTTSLEERMARLEGVMEQMNYRMGSLETRIVSLENGQLHIRQELSAMRKELTGKIESVHSELTDKIDTTRKELTDKIDTTYQTLLPKMDSQFHWILGIILTSWITMVALMIGLFLQKG
jgi:predicted  nucleic acid-binding Zn-ribbon protein